jgi:hypothetical protein
VATHAWERSRRRQKRSWLNPIEIDESSEARARTWTRCDWIYLLDSYSKDEKDDLTGDEKNEPPACRNRVFFARFGWGLEDSTPATRPEN